METSGKHRFWSFPFVWIFILWICRIWGSRSTKLLYQTTRHVHLKKRFIEQKIQFWFPPPMHKSNKLLNTNWTKWVCAGGKNVTSQIKSHSIIVRWNDAPIGHFLANYDNSLSFEYTIGIVSSLPARRPVLTRGELSRYLPRPGHGARTQVRPLPAGGAALQRHRRALHCG